MGNEFISPISLGLIGICSLILFVIMLVGQWKMFEKAGIPGWQSLVPILNTYRLFEIACGNGLKMFLMLIPIAGTIFGIITIHKLSKSFGHGIGLTLLYLIASPVAILILGFGDDEYCGPY